MRIAANKVDTITAAYWSVRESMLKSDVRRNYGRLGRAWGEKNVERKVNKYVSPKIHERMLLSPPARDKRETKFVPRNQEFPLMV